MKNRYLLLILIGLICAAYVVVEKEEQVEETKIDRRRDFLNLANYGHIRDITIQGESFEASTAIQKNLEDFFLELQKLKVDRIFEDGDIDSAKVSDPNGEEIQFLFENEKKVIFKVGKKVDINQSFYLSTNIENQHRWLITRFEVAFPADKNDKNRYRSDIPYKRFKELLRTPKRYFFTDLKDLQKESVK